MKIEIEIDAKSKSDAEFIQEALKDPELYALVVIVAALKRLPDTARRSALDLAISLDDERRRIKKS